MRFFQRVFTTIALGVALQLALSACGGSKPETADSPLPPVQTEAPLAPKAVELPPPPELAESTVAPVPELPESASQAEEDPVARLQEMVEAINGIRAGLKTKTIRIGQRYSKVVSTAYYDGEKLMLIHSVSEGPWGREDASYYWSGGNLAYVYAEERMAADMNDPREDGVWYETQYGIFYDEDGGQIGGFGESDDPSREITAEFVQGTMEHAMFMYGEFEGQDFDAEGGSADEKSVQLGEVTGNNVRLRTEPSIETGDILGHLSEGAVVEILDNSALHEPWINIRYKEENLTGWMHGDYIIVYESPEILPVNSPVETALRKQFANMTYPTSYVFGGAVTLNDGQFEDPENHTYITLGPDVYLGDMNGNGVDDAVVLLGANTGGSAMFVDLYAFENTGSGYVFGGSQFMGDRVKINNVRIEDQKIYVDMITHGEEDPLCCPSRTFVATLNLMGPGAKPSPLREITVTQNGIGSITPQSPFNVDAFARAFAGFDVEDYSFEAEDGLRESIMISLEGRFVAEAYPTGDRRIFSVVFSGGNIVDENGTRLGTPFSANPLQATFDCVPGMEEYSGRIVCTSPEAALMRYIYMPMHYAGPDGVLPPRDVVHNAILSHLVWIPAAENTDLDP